MIHCVQQQIHFSPHLTPSHYPPNPPFTPPTITSTNLISVFPAEAAYAVAQARINMLAARIEPARKCSRFLSEAARYIGQLRINEVRAHSSHDIFIVASVGRTLGHEAVMFWNRKTAIVYIGSHARRLHSDLKINLSRDAEISDIGNIWLKWNFLSFNCLRWRSHSSKHTQQILPPKSVVSPVFVSQWGVRRCSPYSRLKRFKF